MLPWELLLTTTGLKEGKYIKNLKRRRDED